MTARLSRIAVSGCGVGFQRADGEAGDQHGHTGWRWGQGQVSVLRATCYGVRRCQTIAVDEGSARGALMAGDERGCSMAMTHAVAAAPLDVAAIRSDFPILAREVNGHPLVYLDNAATTQKPQAVLAAMDAYYRMTNANVHRGVY